MKISYNWLKDIVSLPETETAETVAEKLTARGLEVAGIEVQSIPTGVIVGYIKKVERHPQADRLCLCTVDTGKEVPLQIVCGAPNVTEGMKAPLATTGTALTPEFCVKKVKIRGIESYGMLCSERELGISENHEGIMALPDSYETGMPLNAYIPDDYIIEIELTPNRGDCLSILGIAREVAATYKTQIAAIHSHPEESDETHISEYIKVTVKDFHGCPRYMGRLILGVTITDSPDWLKKRLQALGLRPINNVVDITNYILLLFGQPMHAFDYHAIEGKEIVVQRASEGEKFTTLDDIERQLCKDDLLICDAKKAVAIAGVMGGSGSGITENTTDVFLECAFFDPVSIRKTSKRLDLTTDSSYRFERGVDPGQGCEYALDTAAALMKQLACGKVVPGVIDTNKGKIEKKTVRLYPSRASRLLGIPLTEETIIEYLKSLDITYCGNDNDELIFSIPTYRHDLVQEVDLIEEIGRSYGYDSIPLSSYTTITLHQPVNYYENVTTFVRTTLSSLGFHETITHSMTADKINRRFAPSVESIALINPLNSDFAAMRSSLLPSLLHVTAYNLNRKNTDNHLFEIGKVFGKNNNSELPWEKEIVGIIIENNYIPKAWNYSGQKADFYVMKGIIESLTETLGIKFLQYSPIQEQEMTFFDTDSARIESEQIKGTFGKVKDEITALYNIKSSVYYAELDISTLLTHGIKQPLYTPLPKFPAIERDFCFLMDETIQAGTVAREIAALSPLLESFIPFDVYRGKAVEAGKKSITYSAKFRALDRTLTDKDADTISEKIIETAKNRFNAELRK